MSIKKGNNVKKVTNWEKLEKCEKEKAWNKMKRQVDVRLAGEMKNLIFFQKCHKRFFIRWQKKRMFSRSQDLLFCFCSFCFYYLGIILKVYSLLLVIAVLIAFLLYTNLKKRWNVCTIKISDQSKIQILN